MRLPSASRLQLALACPASQVLEQVRTAWVAGERGTELHAALGRRLAGVVQDETPEARAWLATLDDEELSPISGASSEVTYSWRPADDEARRVGQHLERVYPEDDDTYLGTADYVSVCGRSVEVVDLKTGNGDVPHPRRNAQLRALALFAARSEGATEARVGILHATGERTWWEWGELDALDLEEVAAELRKLAERISYARADVSAGRLPRLTVGEHCARCQSRHGCPARVAMAQRLAGEPEVVVRDLKALLTPETAALALERWRAAAAALKEVGAALYAYAKESPIPLGDGRVWGPVESSQTTIDAAMAWPVLVGLWGVEGARAAMTLATSKAGLGRGLEVAGGEGSKKARLAAVLEALSAAGAVGERTRTEYEEHDASGGAS